MKEKGKGELRKREGKHKRGKQKEREIKREGLLQGVVAFTFFIFLNSSRGSAPDIP